MHQEIEESPNSEKARYSSVHKVLFSCISKACRLHLLGQLLPVVFKGKDLVSNNSYQEAREICVTRDFVICNIRGLEL